jgi:hypothetical protein
MSEVIIYTDGTIAVGTTITGYWVEQDPERTRVRAFANQAHARPVDLGEEVMMPKDRYTLSTDIGEGQFSADFLEIWNLAKQIKDAPLT